MNLTELIAQVQDTKLRTDLLKALNDLNANRSYGLIFEQHAPELITKSGKEIDITTPYYPYLEYVDKCGIGNHILLEGDNYIALKYLQYTHRAKIDVIYIDPPYNTGAQDWKYNDKFVDKNDAFRHSKWLSFMEKRLRLAKKLLSIQGVIFISIGDDEVNALALLCDEIFGESNRVGTIARLTKKTSNQGVFFAPSKDYVLCYKHTSRVTGFTSPPSQGYIESFKKKDAKGAYKETGLYQASLDGSPNQRYFIKCPDGELVLPPGSSIPKQHNDAAFIFPKDPSDKVWRWSYKTYLIRKSELIFKRSKKTPLITQDGKPAKWNVYVKSYLEQRMEDGLRPRDFIDSFPNSQGTKDLADLDLDFPYAKPVNLIKWLLTLVKNSNATVLDFFAGSGTTYQAVVELNKEDGGKRQCILCTNNENNICKDVTWERIKRVNIEGCNYYRLSIETEDKIDSAYIKTFENFNSL